MRSGFDGHSLGAAYSTARDGDSVVATCAPCRNSVWKIACSPVCDDGMLTVVATQQSLGGVILNTFVETRSSPSELADWLRRVLPPELLAKKEHAV